MSVSAVTITPPLAIQCCHPCHYHCRALFTKWIQYGCHIALVFSFSIHHYMYSAWSRFKKTKDPNRCKTPCCAVVSSVFGSLKVVEPRMQITGFSGSCRLPADRVKTTKSDKLASNMGTKTKTLEMNWQMPIVNLSYLSNIQLHRQKASNSVGGGKSMEQ